MIPYDLELRNFGLDLLSFHICSRCSLLSGDGTPRRAYQYQRMLTPAKLDPYCKLDTLCTGLQYNGETLHSPLPRSGSPLTSIPDAYVSIFDLKAHLLASVP